MYTDVLTHTRTSLWLASTPPLSTSADKKDCSQLIREALPEGCMYMNESTTILHQTCPLKSCTTDNGVCSGGQSVCCCRALQQESVNPDLITCSGTLSPADESRLSDLRLNSTACGCTRCEDVTVTLFVTVKSSEDSSPISAARIQDSNDNLLGFTLQSGSVSFEVRLDSGGPNRELLLEVTALGYFSKSVRVKLTPQNDPISVLIILFPLQMFNISMPFVIRLYGGGVALMAPAGAFVDGDGDVYNGVVQFSGLAAEGGTISPAFGPNQYAIDQTRYAIIYVVFPEFVDNEMKKLDVVRSLTISTNLDPGALDGQSLSLLVLNTTSNEWEFGGDLVQLDGSAYTRRQAGARTTHTYVTPNVPVSQFSAIATTIDADCWLQARTFNNGAALSNGYVVLEQRFKVGTRSASYRFGTDTGVDMNFNDNSICLPLACDRFDFTTVIGRHPTQAGAELRPVPFNEMIFASNESEPIVIGNSFYFEKVVVFNSPATPFYDNETACMVNAKKMADLSDFFSFERDSVSTVVTGECYVRVRVIDCFDANIVNVKSFDAITNALDRYASTTMTIADVNMTIDTEFPSGAMDRCLEAEAVTQSACVPFTCSDVIVIQTQFDPERVTHDGPIPVDERFCNITARSPDLAPAILTTPQGSSVPSAVSLTINTQFLRSHDYNDPMLGLYYHPDPTVARDLCQNVMNTMPLVTDGSAVTFNCV